MSGSTRQRVQKFRAIRSVCRQGLDQIEKLIGSDLYEAQLADETIESCRDLQSNQILHNDLVALSRDMDAIGDDYNTVLSEDEYAVQRFMTGEVIEANLSMNESMLQVYHSDVQPAMDCEPVNVVVESPLERQQRIINKIHHWALETNIQHNHLDKLLVILHDDLLPNLPISSTTFLETQSADYTITFMKDCNQLEPEGD